MSRIRLRLCDERLNIHAQCFGFGQCRVDPFVLDQRIRHIAEQCATMSDFTAEVVEFLPVSHDLKLF
jgi:hypothetical protein